MNHTPGPWVAIKGDTFNPRRTWGVSKYLSREAHFEIDGNEMEYPSRTEVIAEIMDGDAMEANAQLIAAAPALLEALELYLEGSLYINGEMEEKVPSLKRARTLGFKAIQQAKGGKLK